MYVQRLLYANRLKSFRPKKDYAKKYQSANLIRSCFLDNDSHNGLQDPLMSTEMCTKTPGWLFDNDMFVNVRYKIALTHSDTIPYKKCIIDIDVTKVNAENMSKFSNQLKQKDLICTSQMQPLLDKISNTKTSIESIKAQKSKLSADIETEKKKKSDLSRRVNDSKASKDEANATLEGYVQTLKSKSDNYDRLYDEYGSELTALKDTLNRSDLKHQVAMSDLKTRSSGNGSVNDSMKSYQQLIDDLKRDTGTCTTNLKESKNTEHDLDADIASLSGEIATSDRKLNACRTKLQTFKTVAQNELQSLNNEVERCKGNTNILKADSQRNRELVSQLQGLRNAITIKQSEL